MHIIKQPFIYNPLKVRNSCLEQVLARVALTVMLVFALMTGFAQPGPGVPRITLESLAAHCM
jgi:hypothetical protein